MPFLIARMRDGRSDPVVFEAGEQEPVLHTAEDEAGHRERTEKSTEGAKC